MKFEFTLEEVNMLLQGLGELPAKISLGLIQKIQHTAQEQMNQEVEGESDK